MTGPIRRLRVLQVAARYFPDLGGIESHIHEVAQRLNRMPDIEVTVLATDRSGARPTEERAEGGFDVIRRRAFPRNRDYYLAPGIRRVISGGNWDVVHFQGVHTLVPVLGMVSARRARLPYVLTFHSGGNSSATRTAARGVQWRVLTPMLRGASRLIGVSRFESGLFQEATGIDGERFTVIRNGGSLPALTEPVEPVPGRIVSSGRLEQYKGHHRVIQALPSLRRTMADAHVVILGAGPYENELRAEAARLGVEEFVQIYQVDPLDRSAMARELAAAEVFVALSDYEAHPVAVMEALTLGRPVVGFDVAGIGDLVEEGLVTGVATTAYADEIAAVLAGVMGSASTPGFGPDVLPTWDSCAEELAAVYRSVARAPRA